MTHNPSHAKANWRETAYLWWSMTWRWALATIVSDFAIALVARLIHIESFITDMVSALAGLTLSIWALHSALQVTFTNFTVSIEACRSLTTSGSNDTPRAN
jgi:hypothetical protein